MNQSPPYYGVFSDRFFGNICGAISVIHFLVFAFKISSQHLVIYIGGHPVSGCQPLAALQDAWSFHAYLQLDRTSGQLEERNVILLAQVVKPLGKWGFSTVSQRSYGPIQVNYFIAFIPQQIFSLSPSVHHNPGHLSLHMWAAKKKSGHVQWWQAFWKRHLGSPVWALFSSPSLIEREVRFSSWVF